MIQAFHRRIDHDRIMTKSLNAIMLGATDEIGIMRKYELRTIQNIQACTILSDVLCHHSGYKREYIS